MLLMEPPQQTEYHKHRHAFVEDVNKKTTPCNMFLKESLNRPSIMSTAMLASETLMKNPRRATCHSKSPLNKASIMSTAMLSWTAWQFMFSIPSWTSPVERTSLDAVMPPSL